MNTVAQIGTIHQPSDMRGAIQHLEAYALRGPLVARPHWTAHFPVPAGNEVRTRSNQN